MPNWGPLNGKYSQPIAILVPQVGRVRGGRPYRTMLPSGVRRLTTVGSKPGAVSSLHVSE